MAGYIAVEFQRNNWVPNNNLSFVRTGVFSWSTPQPLVTPLHIANILSFLGRLASYKHKKFYNSVLM
ncbi:hypothetical protein J6590_075720 [Homalodisca vitripennis]|nr:hypothetical protein J6590_075720 [Homalodisca vitripennis]